MQQANRAAEASVTAHSLQSLRARNSCADLMVLTGVHAVGSFIVKPDMTSRQSDSHVAHINSICVLQAVYSDCMRVLRLTCRLDRNV